MKIALITDTHWGVRNDNIAFLENTKTFLDNIFFPYLDEHSIKNIIHLGDLVDRRKYINFYTANRLRKDFLVPLDERGITMDVIAGNHDTYFKNTNEINSLTELVDQKYNGISIYYEPIEKIYDGVKILLLPWICDDNRERTYKIMETTNAQICMGHLALQGFEMYKGSPISDGMDPGSFGRFDVVCSGHYHHRSSNGHIFYLGSHGEFTWSDYQDHRGFHIFDTETRELKFIQNPYKMFKKLWYNDKNEDFLKTKINYSEYAGSIVRVIIQNKTNPFWFDKFIENIEQQNPVEIQIVEDHLNLNLEEDSDIVDEAESTVDIFKKYIKAIETPINKEKLENKIVEIYNEALTLE